MKKATGSERVIFEILDERIRQKKLEGYRVEHDDEHTRGEIAGAAAAYAISARNCAIGIVGNPMPAEWPWGFEAWKPKGARRDLVRAAALIVAEIERLDRLDNATAAPL